MYQYKNQNKTNSKESTTDTTTVSKSNAKADTKMPVQLKSLFSPSFYQEADGEKLSLNNISHPAQPMSYSPLQMQLMPKHEHRGIQPLPLKMNENQEKLAPISAKPHNTGIPLQMKERFENLSGFSFDDVRVHYNSEKPAQLQAFAYTRGNRVYIGPGQEKHLGHELGHVVQQKQKRVQTLININGESINNNPGLEREADQIANFGINQTKSTQPSLEKSAFVESAGLPAIIQRFQVPGKRISSNSCIYRGLGTIDTYDSARDDAGAWFGKYDVASHYSNPYMVKIELNGDINLIDAERLDTFIAFLTNTQSSKDTYTGGRIGVTSPYAFVYGIKKVWQDQIDTKVDNIISGIEALPNEGLAWILEAEVPDNEKKIFLFSHFQGEIGTNRKSLHQLFNDNENVDNWYLHRQDSTSTDKEFINQFFCKAFNQGVASGIFVPLGMRFTVSSIPTTLQELFIKGIAGNIQSQTIVNKTVAVAHADSVITDCNINIA